MSLLIRSNEENTIPFHETPIETQDRIKWELDKSPEAFYSRINEISTLFTKGKYSKALAVQRLLDLLYDINGLENSIYNKQVKSRYFLLIFNYIFRIRSTKLRFLDFVRRKLVATDQMLYISGVNFSDLSLPGLRIGKALFNDCDFSKTSLQNINLTGCQFVQCRFGGASLVQAEIAGSSFEGVTLTGANLSSARFTKTSFVGCDFAEIVSSRGQHPLRVNGCNLLACSFRDADLKRADFRNSRMTGCDTLDAKKQDAKGLV